MICLRAPALLSPPNLKQFLSLRFIAPHQSRGITKMASSAAEIDQDQLASFHAHLKQSKRVLALLGAGISASSGLPTFRGAGGLWRTHNAISLASPGAFNEDPGLVWQFYNYRRHMALSVQPNAAHYALAELAKKMPGFQTLTQNVDGLSPRAGHPPGQLKLLHGTLFEVKCASELCGYREANFTDPVVPALAIPTSGEDPTTNDALEAKRKDLDISDINVPLPRLKAKDLPQCPICQNNLLRPGVVWFGEKLPSDVLLKIDLFLDGRDENGNEQDIDLIMVIGTSAKVYPAAGYIDEARARGAQVCVVNLDTNDAPHSGWRDGDWLFAGDAAVIVPELLKPVIGEVKATA
jgi:NAD+-dependent protein deacetylase sirtuin 5